MAGGGSRRGAGRRDEVARGRVLQAGHYVRRRNGDGDVVVLALLATTQAVGVVTAHGDALIDHLHAVAWWDIYEEINHLIKYSPAK